ncbi:charged multivesicular body protein 6-A [Maniola hyperantus]|uniref:charged multivesicular body protein 6-A n=1 Tax=Aphantopus hyperantus TaxID=2795564 RepID=UPI001569F973|nr:charged multivesicular body protein 6-A [Maniola hyperantus]
MGGWFSKSKKPVKSRVTEQDKAVLQLKQQRDKLKQYQKRIELNLERDRQLAKKLLSEDKRDKAKLLLKKKRYQENLLHNADVQLEKLEQLTHDLEFTQIEVQVLDGLKTGNAALKKVHDILNIDEIEKILDETKEGIEKQREIDELISGQLTEEDNEAVEAELESILDVKDQLPEVPADKLPDVVEEETPERPQRVKSSSKKIAVEA